jgi:hypothetical protein
VLVVVIRAVPIPTAQLALGRPKALSELQ